jgi:RecA/RadA recombinase
MAKPMGKKAKSVEFTGSDIKSRFSEALGSLKTEDYQILKSKVQEEFTPSGSIVWDEVCRLRGIPHRGRVVMLHGKEHSGKSTLAYELLEAHQEKTNEPGVIFDFERTCNLEYLEGIGVNTAEDMLVVVQPNSIQQAIQQAIVFMKAGVRFFIFDSIPRMKDQIGEKEVMNGDAFKATVGAHARSMARFYDIILPYAAQYDSCLVMINQHQARIENTMEAQFAAKYPSMTNHNYVLPGGNATRYVPSLSVEVNIAKAYRAGGADDDFLFEGTDDAKGAFIVNKVKVRVLKNKATSGGFKESVIWIRPGKGVDDWISVRELGRHYDLIAPVGRKWRVGNEDNPIVTYENKDQALRELVEEPDFKILSQLRELVVQKIREDKEGFATEITAQDRYAMGDTDDSTLGNAGTAAVTKFKFDSDVDVEL